MGDSKGPIPLIRQQLDQLKAGFGGLGSLGVGVCVIDREFRYVHVNRWLASLNGLSPEEHVGRPLHEIVPRVAKDLKAAMQRVFETGVPILDLELSGDIPSRADVFLRASLLPFRGEGEIVYVTGLVQDISEQKRSERELAEREALLSGITDSLPILIASTDLGGHYRFLSAQYEELAGRPREELLGRHVRTVFGEDIWARVEEPFERACRGIPNGLVVELPGPGDPPVLYLQVEMVPDRDSEGRVDGVIGLAQDVTGEVEARRTAEQSAAAVRELAGRLIGAQEDERSRVARELHDDLTQRLAGVALDAAALEREVSPEESSVRSGLADLRAKLQALSVDVHRLSRQLHPSMLHDLGLAESLHSECDAFAEREGIRVETEIELPPDLEHDTALALYRIAQEGLRNVGRHSESERATVLLTRQSDELRLRIEDEGVGFDVRAHAGSNGASGLGLASMRERARLVGGVLEIDSAPGRGTSVEVRVPLARTLES